MKINTTITPRNRNWTKKEEKILADKIIELQKSYTPYIKQMQELNKDFLALKTALSDYPTNQIIESVKIIQKSTILPALRIQESLKSSINLWSEPFITLSASLQTSVDIFKKIKDIYVKFPISAYIDVIDASTKVTLKTTNIKWSNVDKGYLGTEQELNKSTTLGPLTFKQAWKSQNIISIEPNPNLLDQSVVVLVDDRLQTLPIKEVIEGYLSFKNAGFYILGKVRNISFKKQIPELVINNSSIEIKNPSHRLICEVLFKNEKSMVKEWSVDEFLEQIGEDEVDVDFKVWGNKIRQRARHLNEYIAKESFKQLEPLILAGTKYIRLNPKYLPDHLR